MFYYFVINICSICWWQHCVLLADVFNLDIKATTYEKSTIAIGFQCGKLIVLSTFCIEFAVLCCYWFLGYKKYFYVYHVSCFHLSSPRVKSQDCPPNRIHHDERSMASSNKQIYKYKNTQNTKRQNKKEYVNNHFPCSFIQNFVLLALYFLARVISWHFDFLYYQYFYFYFLARVILTLPDITTSFLRWMELI